MASGWSTASTAKAPTMISGGSTPTVKKSLGRTSSARPRDSSTNHRSKNIDTRPTIATLTTIALSATATPSATTARPGSRPSSQIARVWLTGPR